VTEAHVRSAFPDSSASDSAEIAVGAAAGELLGEVLGDVAASTETAPGTMVTLTTRGGSAILPAGSAITVQLTEPLEV
jgi:hypothetical protein